MKKFCCLLSLFIAASSFAQLRIQVGFTLDGVPVGEDAIDQRPIPVLKKFTDLKVITIQAQLPAKHELKITVNGEPEKRYKRTDNQPETFTFIASVIGNEIHIEHMDRTSGTDVPVTADERKFKIINNLTDDADDGTKNNNLPCISCMIDAAMSKVTGLTEKPFGLYDEKENTVHLFFDYLGNSLLSTIPQGIANAKYKIHILYPVFGADADVLSYSVKQKSGTFSSALLFNNSDIRSTLGNILKQQSLKTPTGIADRTFLLGTATDDLSFDIIATSMDGSTVKKTVLESYTIKMSPVYHGSFDVGLLKTDLANPTYNLVLGPAGTDKVVKETDGGSRGVVTIMASFYTSPIVLLESLVKKNKIPFYKRTGRSFLDDHKFYERIYPTIGVSVSAKTLDNLFYGFNFELARGLNIFAGWHYGKVNVFNMPGYQESTTVVTQQQFDFYQKTEWKTSTSFGIKVDAMIIKTLFGGSN